MRWLITGAKGQLGSDLVRLLAGSPDELLAVGSSELDVTDSAAIESTVSAFEPDVIINAAAYTAVDAAETDEDRAFVVNGAAPGLLAASAVRHGAKLIHLSTDYVFAGDADTPYEPAATPDPKSAYGRTKLAGEQAVLTIAADHGYVVRTAWVYGQTGANFVKTMARLEKSNDTVSVADDQIGSPTWSFNLAQGLVELGRSTADPGVYHCTNTGQTSWHGFAQAIFFELGADPARVLNTDSAAFVRPAPRPAYSVLSGESWMKAGLSPLPDWRTALRDAFAVAGESLSGA